MREKVNHPKHYGGEDNPYEAIKVIDAWKLGFSLGNAVKYIARAGAKGDKVIVSFNASLENKTTVDDIKNLYFRNNLDIEIFNI